MPEHLDKAKKEKWEGGEEKAQLCTFFPSPFADKSHSLCTCEKSKIAHTCYLRDCEDVLL